MNLYKLHTHKEELLGYEHRAQVPMIVWDDIMKRRKRGYLADIQRAARDGRYRDVLKNDAEIATLFARDVLNGRFEEAEDIIATSAKWSYVYAVSVLGNERFEQGEPAIATDSGYSLSYAFHVLEDRFKMGEPAIRQNEKNWNMYKRQFNI